MPENTYNIPEMLEKGDPFGQLLLEFVSNKFKDEEGREWGVEMGDVYPHKNYGETTIGLQLNGVDVPPEMFKAMFLEYAKIYAKSIIHEALMSRTNKLHGSLHSIDRALDKAHREIRSEFGLPLEDHEY